MAIESKWGLDELEKRAVKALAQVALEGDDHQALSAAHCLMRHTAGCKAIALDAYVRLAERSADEYVRSTAGSALLDHVGMKRAEESMRAYCASNTLASSVPRGLNSASAAVVNE